jgi:hypothetical protein
MPLDATPQLSPELSPDDIEAQARAFAAKLDALLHYPDEAVEDALLAIGELLGGLSVGGFSADLRSHLDRVEQDLIEDAHPSDVSRGWGPNDPNNYISGRLEDRIAESRACDAQDWLDEAQSLLDRALLRETA